MTTSPNSIQHVSSYFETKTTDIDMVSQALGSREVLRDLSPLIVSWQAGETTVTIRYPFEFNGIKVSIIK